MPIRLLNIDLHISVISDVMHILKDIYGDKVEITNHSISGHNWVFDRPTARPEIVNQFTWKRINEDMINRFAEHYESYCNQFDGFIVTHTPIFALLYEKFNKPVIVVNSCRYEQPYSWSDDMENWEWLNNKLANMKNLHIISNNKADQEYLKLGTGLDSIHVPSLCLYTNEKYTGTKDEVIKHGSLKSPYKWSDLYSHKGIYHFPYEISTMSIFEQYSANIPLFFPSKKYLKENGGLRSIYGKRVHPKLEICMNNEWWIERADYYDVENMKHIVYFDNLEDLEHKKSTTDFKKVSELMAEHNKVRKKKVYTQWKTLFDSTFESKLKDIGDNKKMVKISYAICVCNEDREVNSLINFLLKVKDEEDEVNILLDSKNGTEEVRSVLESFGDKIVVNEREFDGKFSDHRNYHATKCTGDYIFAIDADEMPQEGLIRNIKTFDGDIMYIPRINICPGYTAEWITDYKFNLNEMGWINFPDYQGRYYKNNEKIKWSSDLHERLTGSDQVARLDPNPLVSLWHIKTVERQDKQRAYYESL
jgi:hypothetical protein